MAIMDNPAGILGWAVGPVEIVIIVILILLLFGGKKIPELARGIAKALKLFKKEMSEVENHVQDAVNPAAKPAEDESQKQKDSSEAENQSPPEDSSDENPSA